MSDSHVFSIHGRWNIDAKTGALSGDATPFEIPTAGDAFFGGIGGAANPEELLLCALASCFLQTWAIFLAKLKVPIDQPSLAVECTVEKDPAGGFRVSAYRLRPAIPAELMATRRDDVEKTLGLAEKYCIVSKAVKRDGVGFEVLPA